MSTPADRTTIWARTELSRFLDDTFGKGNWGHSGLRKAIQGLTAAEARWKPSEDAHSVWEQLNHIAHWKRYALRRAQGRRPRSYQAWPPAGRTEAQLRKTVADLRALHREMLATVRRLSGEDLTAQKGGALPGLAVAPRRGGPRGLSHRPDLPDAEAVSPGPPGDWGLTPATRAPGVAALSGYLAVFSAAVPFSLLYYGVRVITASRVSVTAMLEPAVAAVAAWVLLGEVLGATRLVGGGLILAAVGVLVGIDVRPAGQAGARA